MQNTVGLNALSRKVMIKDNGKYMDLPILFSLYVCIRNNSI